MVCTNPNGHDWAKVCNWDGLEISFVTAVNLSSLSSIQAPANDTPFDGEEDAPQSAALATMTTSASAASGQKKSCRTKKWTIASLRLSTGSSYLDRHQNTNITAKNPIGAAETQEVQVSSAITVGPVESQVLHMSYLDQIKYYGK